MTDHKFSIIVPVYNASLYLAECIESIINQTYKEYELILINDGSTDDSGIICDRFSLVDKRIRTYHISNNGVSFARNLGIEKATGDFILFVDADDYLKTTCLAKYAECFDMDIVWQGMIEFCETGLLNEIHLENRKAVQKDEQYIIFQQLYENHLFGFTWSKMFRRSIIDKYGIRFKHNVTVQEDELFTLEYIKYIRNCATINNIGYCYRNVCNSLSHRYWDPYKLFIALSYKNSLIDENGFSKLFYTLLKKSFEEQYQYILYNICEYNLYNYRKRIEILSCIYSQHLNESFFIINPLITEIVYCARYYIRKAKSVIRKFIR